jgi:phosphohistidine phosphatase
MTGDAPGVDAPGASLWLWVVRHAKAEPGVPGSVDLARRLTEGGRAAATACGEAIRAAAGELGAPHPGCVLASPAARTLETASLVTRALGAGEPIADAVLYLGGADEALGAVQELAQGRAAVLVGHNPTVTWLVHALTGGAELESMPTAGIAAIELQVSSWSAVAPGVGRLRWTGRGSGRG